MAFINPPAALPGTPTAGTIAIDSENGNALKWYTGSVWQAAGGGTPAGASGEVQYNDSGAFGANSSFTYASGTAASYDGTAGSSWSTTGTLAANASGNPHRIEGNGSCIVAANNTFSGNAAYISRDAGTTWTAISSLFGISYAGVAWTGKHWLLGANAAYVKYSDDNGVNWVTASTTNSDSYYTIIPGTGSLEGTVVIIGTSFGYIKYSTNHGVTWANATAPPGSTGILAAAKGCCTGTEFILYAGTYCWYSTNGSTWITRTSTAVGTAVYLQGRGLVYDPINDCLTGITPNTSTSTKILFSNDDGATWSYQTAPNTSAATDIVVVNGVRIITCSLGNIHRSTDNSTWSNSTAGSATLNAICHSIGQGIFLFPLSNTQPYKAADGYTPAVLANVANTSGKFSTSAISLTAMVPPSSPATGLMIADSTNLNRLSIYDGTAWKLMGTGGPTNAIQYNASGAQAGSPNFLFDGITAAVGGASVSSTAMMTFAAGTATKSQFRLTAGTHITTPVDGDIWYTSSPLGIFASIGTNVKAALANVVTATTNRFPVWSVDTTAGRLVDSALSYSAIAGGLTQISMTTTHSANASDISQVNFTYSNTNGTNGLSGVNQCLAASWSAVLIGEGSRCSGVYGYSVCSMGAANGALPASAEIYGVRGVAAVYSAGGLLYSGSSYTYAGVCAQLNVTQTAGQSGSPLIASAGSILADASLTFGGTLGTGAISEVFGLKVRPATLTVSSVGRSVTVTNYYGVYIAGPTTAGSGAAAYTNKYGIYQADAASTNYFAGLVNAAGGITGAYTGTYITLTPTTTPATSAGRIFVDTGDSNKLKWYNGTSWQTATSDVLSVTRQRFAAGVDFTAGTTTQLTLSAAPPSATSTIVTFDGVTQHGDQWSLSSTTLTFTSAIPTGVLSVEVSWGSGVSIGTPSDGTVTNAKLAAGALPFWARILNTTPIAITSATSATADRMHTVAGTTADYTITLPVSPAEGVVVGFTVTDWATANKQYTLDAGGTVKIAGRTRYLVLLHTNTVLLRFNGTGWQPLELHLDTPAVTVASPTIYATTTDPTKPDVADITYDSLVWRRIGDQMHVQYRYGHTAAGTSGSGQYYIAPPIGTISGYVHDKVAYGTAQIYSGAATAGLIVTATVLDIGSSTYRFAIEGVGTGGNTQSWGTVDVNQGRLGVSTIRISFTGLYPMLNW